MARGHLDDLADCVTAKVLKEKCEDREGLRLGAWVGNAEDT